MITILPATEPDKSRYLERTGLLAEVCELLLMKDGSVVLGGVAVAVQHSELVIHRLFVEGAELSSLTAEQRFIADSLLRAARSFRGESMRIPHRLPAVGRGRVFPGGRVFGG